MSGVKISALPAISAPAVGDLYAVVQGGVTYKETGTQLIALVSANLASSGTGNFAKVNNPTFTGPILGAASATSLSFSPTTGGIIGTTTNDDAGAGKVGEILSTTRLLASAISLTSTMISDVVTVSLTAGDWDVYGNVFLNGAGSNVSSLNCWISASSAALPDLSKINTIVPGADVTNLGCSAPYFRASLAGTSTIYLSAKSTFSSTCTACGGIFARRVR